LNSSYDIVGSIFNDTIIVVDSANASWCGATLQPITQSGHNLQLHGSLGDDSLYGGGSVQNQNWIWGDAGNDTLYLGHAGQKAEGGDGNDYIYGADDPGDILVGDGGNDVICSHFTSTSTAVAIDGGDGYDTVCGLGAHLNNSIEVRSCFPCGPGY
jgi:Ca2+-binding RTX toxin-like protein